MIKNKIFKTMMAGILSAVILLPYLPSNIVLAAPPEIATLYRSDDFNDNVFNNTKLFQYKHEGVGGTINESDGKVNLVRSGVEGEVMLQIRANGDYPFTDNAIMKFTLSKQTDAPVYFTLYPYEFLTMKWEDDKIYIAYRDNPDDSGADTDFRQVSGTYDDDAEFVITCNVPKSRFSCWINGELVLENVYSRARGTSGEHAVPSAISEVRLYTQSGAEGDTFSLDDMQTGLPNLPTPKSDLDAEWLTLDVISGGESLVSNDINLPTVGQNGSTITWTSSDEQYISNDGKVTRPDGVDSNPVVTLTAKITAENITNTKQFEIAVLRILNSDKDKAEADAAALTQSKLTLQRGKISSNLSLPTTGEFGSSISWESNNEQVIASDGTVVRPANSEGNKTVTLTATVTKGDAVVEKEIPVTVKARVTPVEVVEVLEEDDFNDGISDAWSIDQSSGIIRGENGYVYFERPSNSGTINMTYNFDKTYTGVIGLDFTASLNPNDWGARMRINGNAVYTDFEFSGNGIMNDCGRGSLNESSTWRSFGPASDIEVMDYTILFNTEKGTYSIFENGNIVVKNRYSRVENVSSISQFIFYLDGGISYGAVLDDFRVYKALPLEDDRLDYDYNWLTESLFSEEAVTGEVRGNLNLPTTAYAGSTITWYTSDSSVITTDGVVTRPEGETSDDKTVTLTAKVSYNGKNKYKTFTFKVLRYFATDEARIAADLANFEADHSSLTPESFDSITKSLNFTFDTRYGSEVSFETSDENIITQSGRVIRERQGGEAHTVTLTATFKSGEASVSRDYELTVLPEATFVDTHAMTDEELFGKWENDSWTVVGKFDYANTPKLSAIEEAVKAGDYSKAKEALLAFVRSKEPVYQFSADVTDGTLYRANAAIDGMFGAPYHNFAQGEFSASGEEWQTYTAEILTSAIIPGGVSSLKLMGWYNESSILEVQSKEGGEGAYIQLNVNGKPQKFYLTDDATIRTGIHKGTADKNEDILYARTFGEFLGDETSQILFKFDFSSLTDNDIITDPRLIVKARVMHGGNSVKRIMVANQQDSTWKEGSVAWNDLIGFFYNFNGTGYTWERIPGDDIEVRSQNARFYPLVPLTSCYVATRDEKYAYGAIKMMEDFITKKGNAGNYDQGDWPRGQYARDLDTAERLEAFCRSLVDLSQSSYMTPDAITAIYKHIWDMGHSFTEYRSDYANWAQNEMTRLYNYSPWLSEFTESTQWREMAEGDLIPMIYNNNFDDGSYVEATQGYNFNAMNQFVSFKELAESRDTDVGAEYDEMLLKAAYYNRLMVTPDGRGGFAWGDAELGGPSEEVIWPQIYEWYGDKEYEYITTYGQSGTEPEWTSKVFRDNGTTTMRSSWSRDALFLFTNVRGSGGHGHSDDNHIYMQAYGRPLLVDTGIITYTGGSPEKMYGISSRGHNTVSINGKNQKCQHYDNNVSFYDHIGTINDWVTGKNIDFLSQTSVATDDGDVTRTILFVKPYYFIVSDFMEPVNPDAENTYHQYWHMLPEGKLSADDDADIIKSNFSEGANVLLASVDDVTTGTGDGWFDYSYNEIAEIKDGYFFKKQSGNATFDTVIAPSRNDTNATLETERLELGVDTTVATAMKLVSKADGATNTGYYYLSYEENPTAVRTFGKYTSNGQMAFVNENTDGNINIAAMKDASYIKNGSEYLVKFDRTVSDVSLAMQGTELEIHTAEADITDIMISDSFDFATLSVNGERVAFETKDGYIVIDKDGEVTTPSDNNNGGNLIGGSTDNKDDKEDKPSGGNGGSGSGGSGGSGSGVPGVVTPPAQNNYFTDVADTHWAKQSIEELYKKGIINGKAEHIYAPDDNVTRAEFVSLIVRSLGVENVSYNSSFEDVASGDWYADSIETALSLGLISKDTFFRPNDSITREEMAKIIVGASELNETIDLPNDFALKFTDTDSISDWAKDFVAKATYLELLKGDDARAFNPKNNLTRAESAMVIYRFLQ